MKVKEIIELHTRVAILDYARRRNDLWDYDDDCLVDFVIENPNRDIDEALDQFTYENWKDNLFDYLNNILFTTHTQVMDTARERFNNELGITIDENDLAYYVSEFIDGKELYDLDYED